VGCAPAHVLCGHAGVHARGDRSTAGRSGFTRVPVAGLELWFRAPAGPRPDVLEIGLRGKRRPRVEAYWDGCLFALGA
jgi:hypothetical protein